MKKYATSDKRKEYRSQERVKAKESLMRKRWAAGKREYFRAAARKSVAKLKFELFSHYSGGEPKCLLCNFKDLRALSIDHIDGGGAKHRKETKNKVHLWLRRNGYPDGFCVLCMNCQFIKRKDFGEEGGGGRLSDKKTVGNREIHRLRGVHARLKVLTHYSSGLLKCKHCSIGEYSTLTVDHIQAGGKTHRKEIKVKVVDWIIKNGYPDGFQVLCMNCQWIKRSVEGELSRR